MRDANRVTVRVVCLSCLLVACWLGVFALVGGCGGPPREQRVRDLATVLVAVAEAEGVDELPLPVARQVASLLRGEAVEPVERTAENQIVSPLTGRPCVCITREGLTRAGAAFVRLLVGTVPGLYERGTGE